MARRQLRCLQVAALPLITNCSSTSNGKIRDINITNFAINGKERKIMSIETIAMVVTKLVIITVPAKEANLARPPLSP